MIYISKDKRRGEIKVRVIGDAGKDHLLAERLDTGERIKYKTSYLMNPKYWREEEEDPHTKTLSAIRDFCRKIGLKMSDPVFNGAHWRSNIFFKDQSLSIRVSVNSGELEWDFSSKRRGPLKEFIDSITTYVTIIHLDLPVPVVPPPPPMYVHTR